MDVELLVIPGCPGAEQAATLLSAALSAAGLADATFTVRVIDTEHSAQACGFAGSPAFVVDGVDLFDAGDGRGALACRVYPTPEGPRNLPDLRDLRTALERRSPTGRD